MGQSLADRAKLNTKIGVIDRQPRPDDRPQFIRFDDSARALDHGEQQIESTTSQPDHLTVSEKHPLRWDQLESAKLV